ncbi:MAG TPA: hypothetical protein VEH58_02050, partial [Dehalococcoidales bacterium]|nr:hypothetical protein [Dehalococcoidales bacterium]
GFTKMLQEDRSYYSYSRLVEMIAVSLAGMATEKMIYNEASSGAQSDLRNATALAEKMVTDLGMSKNLGPRTFGDKQENVFLGMEMTKAKDYSERTALAIDREVDQIISDANEMASKILTDNKETLINLTKTLITKETMDYDDLEAFFKSNVPADKLPSKNPWSELKTAAAQPISSPAQITIEKPEEKKT